MALELKKRIITSIFLLLTLFCILIDNKFFIFVLLSISVISLYEFYNLFLKIFKKIMILRIIANLLTLTYIIFFSLFLYFMFQSIETRFFGLITILICVFSDIVGIVFGKIFKGKKLTKISPNKTISGTIGSFIFSLLFLFFLILINLFPLSWQIIFYVVFTSVFCQVGDLFISYLKRKAKVKDTGKILPGHGGLLDRIDGMLLAIPLSSFVFYILSI